MKILGQSRSDRWYEELLRKSGGENNDLRKEIQEYYDSIPMGELLNYIKELVDVPELQLTPYLNNDTIKYASISIRSNDIAKTNHLLSLAFKRCEVGTWTNTGHIILENLEEYENGAEPLFKTQFRIDLIFTTNTDKWDAVKLFTASYSQSKGKWKFNEIKR
jgi:hypothetical protein